MKKRILGLLGALCISVSGCAATQSESTGAPPTTVPTAVITTSPTAPSQPISPQREPVLAPPDVQIDDGFFSDCAFVGDSVTYGLMLECMRTGDLGDALFLATKSLGLNNSLFGSFTHSYQGQAMTTEEALAASGAKRVFLMLGMNDLNSIAPQQCSENFGLLVSRIREKCPDIQIIIQSCTPIYTGSEEDGLTNANVDLYNTMLQNYAQQEGLVYLDVASYLKDQTGGIAHRYCSDNYVHLTSEGAQVWIAVLRSFAAQQGEPHE